MEKLIAELNVKLDDMAKLVAKRDEEIAKLGAASAETSKKSAALDGEIVAMKKELDEEKKHRDDLEKKFGRPGFSAGDALKSVGEQFVESEQFKSMVSARRFTSDAAAVKGLLSRESHLRALKGLTSDALSGGALVTPMRYAEIITAPNRAFRLRDLLTVAATTSNAIEYAEETGFSNLYTVLTANMAPADVTVKVESTDGFYPGQSIKIAAETRIVDTVTAPDTLTITIGITAGKSIGDSVTSKFFAPTAEGATKPQGNIAYELKSVPVKTIAHWIPASRQILADAANLRSQIDGRLIYGLGLTEEEQVLYGDGLGENMAGILTNLKTQVYLWSTGEVGDSKIDAIRRAMTLARVAEYPVTGIVLNPEDWEDVELAKGDDGHYIWLVVQNGVANQLFRVPVVDTTAIRSGECLVGAFSLGATLFDREEATVRVAEQHADFFIKNMVALLAESRAALAVFRPEAFVKCTFDSQPVAP